MASGFLSFLDDVAALMDDVAGTAKLATRKTAGILGDDLAVNAEKATGFLASRELPVLWAITKGSFVNKLIIVPVALLLTSVSPIIIKIILVIGGGFLAYEGAEKIIEYIAHRRNTGSDVVAASDESDGATEKIKVRSAITTDFILSVEIVIIALETVLDKSLLIQILTVSVVAIIATVGVYGLVALVVRLDDVGYHLIKRSNNKGLTARTGRILVQSLPVIIKIFAFVGTIALLLVSGGIFVHASHHLEQLAPQVPSIIKEFIVAFLVGIIIVSVKKLFTRK